MRFERVVEHAVLVTSSHIADLEDAAPVFIATETVAQDSDTGDELFKEVLSERAARRGGTHFVVERWTQAESNSPDKPFVQSGPRGIDAQERQVENGGTQGGAAAVVAGISAVAMTVKRVILRVYRVEPSVWSSLPPALRPTVVTRPVSGVDGIMQ